MSTRLSFFTSLAGGMLLALAGTVHCGDDQVPFHAPSAGAGASSSGGGGGSSGGECSKDADCGGNDEVCEQGQCLPSHCVDGRTNEDESDVDCGGDCLPCENGAACNDAADCASKFCDDGTDGGGGSAGEGGGDQGGAMPRGASLCAPCSEDDDCGGAGGTFCEEGVCVGQKKLGETCASGSECESGFCPEQDGVCCDQRCDSPCEACAGDKTGAADGACAPVSAETDPDAECEDSGAESCGSNGTGCNGDALEPACRLYPAGTECAPLSCVAGELVPAQSCDGVGSCVADPPQSCAPYACAPSGDACLTSCSGDSECDSNHYCAGGSCVPKKSNGDGCTADGQCVSGHCPAQDLVCCDAACGGLCESCLASKNGGANGTCGYVLDNTDPDSECTGTTPNCDGAGMCGLL